ncbi:hypothetical protein BHE74_00026318, partial [Ensete ventricosum]
MSSLSSSPRLPDGRRRSDSGEFLLLLILLRLYKLPRALISCPSLSIVTANVDFGVLCLICVDNSTCRNKTLWLPVTARNVDDVCTAQYGRCVPVRQVIGMRTARYRAVSKIDRRWSIEGEKGKKKKKEEDLISPRRPRLRIIAARGQFFSRARRRN